MTSPTDPPDALRHDPRPDESADLAGIVVGFDEHVGLGTIEADGTSYRFHCVEIADGTRSIVVGAPVRFSVRAKFGRYEAADVRLA